MTAPEDRRGGRVRRVSVKRTSSARCIQCGKTWDNAHAIAHGTQHAERTGHVIEADYAASYVYVPTAPPVLAEDAGAVYADRVRDFVAAHPGASAHAISSGVTGNRARVRMALAALIESGHVVVIDDGVGRSRRHYLREVAP